MKGLGLFVLALTMSGCSESAILAGNGLSMLVVCLLLYSTVNLSRSTD